MNTAIVTDSNSGITQQDAEKLCVSVIPMPFLIDGEQYLEGVNLSQEEFYKRLTDNSQVSTSQPSAYDVGELWKELLKTHDKVIHIPMSSGLSETCSNLTRLADEEFAGKVYVIDNQRISVPLRRCVEDAVKMRDEGNTAEQIRDYLLETKMQSSIYIMVDTLKYLKRGGRLTPAAAMIGTLLKIKPVLQIQGYKLDSYAKVRKLLDAKESMLEGIEYDLKSRFADLRKQGKLCLAVAHTDNFREAKIFSEEIKERFKDIEFYRIDALSLSVACHTGPGALGCAVMIKR